MRTVCNLHRDGAARAGARRHGHRDRAFGLRFEARGYATLLNSDGGFFCGGSTGCVVSISGTALYQGEALVGLSGRF